MPTLLNAIEQVDDNTVRFRLNQPEAPFLNIMATDFASILSKEQAEQMLAAGTPEQLDQAPSGTGPFQLVAYQKDAVIRYKANPDYWEGKAAIDDLVFAITPDAERPQAEARGRRMPRHALSESVRRSRPEGQC